MHHLHSLLINVLSTFSVCVCADQKSALSIFPQEPSTLIPLPPPTPYPEFLFLRGDVSNWLKSFPNRLGWLARESQDQPERIKEAENWYHCRPCQGELLREHASHNKSSARGLLWEGKERPSWSGDTREANRQTEREYVREQERNKGAREDCDEQAPLMGACVT